MALANASSECAQAAKKFIYNKGNLTRALQLHETGKWLSSTVGQVLRWKLCVFPSPAQGSWSFSKCCQPQSLI